MIVVAAFVEVRVHGARSLKAKRGVVRSIVGRVRNRFNLSIAEVGGQDTWQRAELGLCAVGSDAVHVRGQVERAIAFIEELHLAELGACDVEIVHLPHAGDPSEGWDEGGWDDASDDTDEGIGSEEPETGDA